MQVTIKDKKETCNKLSTCSVANAVSKPIIGVVLYASLD